MQLHCMIAIGSHTPTSYGPQPYRVHPLPEVYPPESMRYERFCSTPLWLCGGTTLTCMLSKYYCPSLKSGAMASDTASPHKTKPSLFTFMNFHANFKKVSVKTMKTLVFTPFSCLHSETCQTLSVPPWTSATQFDLWLPSEHCQDSVHRHPNAIKPSIAFPPYLCFLNDCCILQVISRRPELG